MEVTIKVNCDGAAFKGDHGAPFRELKRILLELAERVSLVVDIAQLNGAVVRDAAGNEAGDITVTDPHHPYLNERQEPKGIPLAKAENPAVVSCDYCGKWITEDEAIHYSNPKTPSLAGDRICLMCYQKEVTR